MTETPYILAFDADDATTQDLVGGKGANLGRLTAAGFAVPGGFTVTTASHARVLGGAVAAEIAAIVATLDYADPVDLETRTARIRQIVVGAPIPDDVSAALTEAYASLGEDHYVAVRSSGTAEDLADASFAGLHDTFLDVRGPEAVADAVRACWASMWTARATAYRHENGFDHGEARLAVVVQRMIESDAAGVLFTANPLTTATDEMVLNAAFGLGEAVVGGTVTPDEYVVHHADLRILDRWIADKAIRIVRDPDAAHGTIIQEVPDAERGEPSLTDDQVRTLARVGRRVQDHYDGFPQDIEWAVADGQVYLLQSRPITGVPFSWDADLEESNINHGLEDDWVWTRVFADTVCTGGMTPLNYTIRFTAGMNECWNHLARCAGIRELDGMRAFRYYKGELYYNCHWERIWLERMVIPQARAPMSMSMVPTAWHDEISAAPFDWKRYGLQWLSARLIDPRVYAFKKLLEEFRTERRDEIIGLTAEELTDLSDGQLKSYLSLQLRREVEYGAPVVVALMWHMSSLMTLMMGLLAKWYDGDDPIAAFTVLISGSTERTDTQVENHKLWELSQLIRESDEVRALFDAHPGAAFFEACESSEAGREFLSHYRPFAEQYGHRGQADRDIIYDRRAENPGCDYPAFQSMLSVASPVDPLVLEEEVNARREAKLEEVIANVSRKPLGFVRAETIKMLYKIVHEYIIMRDNERQFPNDAVIMSWKRGLLEVGRRLAERGLIDSERDVLYLGHPEAYALLDGNTSRLALAQAKIQGRKRNVERRMSGEVTMPKYIQHNRPADLDTPIDAHLGEGVFAGMPTSPGSVTGRARIIRTLGEIGQVEHGDILVTNSTDPGWTPVFLVISGVVVETGGMLSHASCLAREYGFPAVQLEGATRLLTDGDLITIDGGTGRVTIVTEESQPAVAVF